MAKKKSKKSGGTKAPSAKKKTAITFVKKRKRARRNPDSGSSVAIMMVDLASQAVPVVVTFAGSHVLAHVVGDRLLGGRSWSKHLKVLTALTAVAGAYFAGRTKPLEKYQTGMVIGTTLAALQTILQAYLPQFSWILGGSPAFAFAPPKLALPQQQKPRAPGDDEDEDYGDQPSDDLSDLQGIFGDAGSGSGWNAAA